MLKELAAAQAKIAELEGERAPAKDAPPRDRAQGGDEPPSPSPLHPERSAGINGTGRELGQYRAILNSLREGVLSLDTDGKLLTSNRAARDLLKWSPIERAGQEVHARIHPPQADMTPCSVGTCPILTALTSDETLSGEDVYARGDGTSIPVEYTISPGRNAGQPMGAVLVFSDASRQLEARTRLEALRASFRATFEQLAVGIAHVSLNGTILRANARMGEMLGYSPGELVGMRSRAVAHPDDYAVAVECVGRLLAGEGVSYSYETRMITKAQRTFWATVTGSLVTTPVAEPNYLLVVIESIDERKALERQLREREREAKQQASEAQATLDAIPHPVLVFNLQGRIVRTNASAQDYMLQIGLTTDEHFGTDERPAHFNLAAADGRELAISELPLRRVLEGEVLTSANSVEIRLMDRVGGDLFMSVTGAPVRDSEGKIVEAVCVFRDVTRHRQLENDLAARMGQMEAIFDAMTDGVVVVDEAGNLLMANTAYRSLYTAIGWDEDIPRELAVHGQRLALRDPLGRVMEVAEWPMTRALLGEALRGKDTIEASLISGEGRDVRLIVTGGPIRNTAGMLLGAVCIFRDTSERRSLLREAREMLFELLEIAASTTQPLSDDELVGDVMAHAQLIERAGRIANVVKRKLGVQRAMLTALTRQRESLVPLAANGMTPEQEQAWRETTARSTFDEAFDAEARARLLSGEDVEQPLDALPPAAESAPRTLLTFPVRAGEQLLGLLVCEVIGTMRELSERDVALAHSAANMAALVIAAEGHMARMAAVGGKLRTPRRRLPR